MIPLQRTDIAKHLKETMESRLLRFLSGDADGGDVVIPSHEFVLVSEQLSLERKQRVMKMMATLTKRQQEVTYLRYFEELSCDQIAAVMDLSRQAVYNLVHHALERMRKGFTSSKKDL